MGATRLCYVCARLGGTGYFRVLRDEWRCGVLPGERGLTLYFHYFLYLKGGDGHLIESCKNPLATSGCLSLYLCIDILDAFFRVIANFSVCYFCDAERFKVLI